MTTTAPRNYAILRDTQSGDRRPEMRADFSLKRKGSWSSVLLYGGLAVRVVTRPTK